MKTILDIQNLSISFERFGDKTEIVKSLSMQIFQNQRIALVGESGSGKSVTAMSLLRLHDEKYVKYQGKIIFNQTDDILKLDNLSMQQIRGSDITMIFQEPASALNPLWTIGAQLSENIRLHSNNKTLNKKQIKNRALELLDLVCIQNSEQRINNYPHMLSGGQRQRVMIAMALAGCPKLLIADEPTTALDVNTQSEIMELLLKLQQQNKMAILLITHNLLLVKSFAQNVFVMQKGQIVESGTCDNIFKSPQHHYTKKLLEANKLSQKPHQTYDKTILETKNLSKTFKIKKGFFDRKPLIINALDKIDFKVKQGSTLGVVGESGSGKSTLAKCILNLQTYNGTIKFNNKTIKDLNRKQIQKMREFLQIVFQDPFASLSPRLTIGQIICEGLGVFQPNNSDTENNQKMQQVLKNVGLPADITHLYPHEFSGGQRQRIAIARAIILKPSLIILDEPTSALDVSTQKNVLELLQDLQTTENLTYIFISHDLNVIRAICDEVIVLKQGKIVEKNSTDKIFKNPQHTYTQQLVDSIL
ncbi:MAG: microcin ABC transporter ATP-binding protein [Gammaproteobacteria bacterium]|nr:MAG: microcin ABC transporter ATP-binding protein [Gammaproteobacteria bacterium]